jgi:hypothetical protein
MIVYARWFLCLLPAVFLGAGTAGAQTRKALLVGIGTYIDKPAGAPAPWQPHGLRKLPVMGVPTRKRIPPLKGPQNDVESMKRLLIERYHFRSEDVRVLSDSDATADRIIEEFQNFLVKDAHRNDIRVFYYSGHGSRIRNKSPLAKLDQFDETIVPADALLGVPDIRDKDLGRLYRTAADAGIRLAVIQDSCYSGSASRGTVVYRSLEGNDAQWVVDPPDQKGDVPPSPEKMGVLVFGASQNDEKSTELPIDGRPQGLFTWALFQVLWQTPDERMDRVIVKVRNLMASVPQMAHEIIQEPVLGGSGRLSLGLLGQTPSSDPAAAAIATKDADGKTVEVTGGPATGIYPGCELIRLGKTPVRIRITKTLDLYSSEAEAAGGSDLAGVVRNDEFKVTRWFVPAQAALHVYVPPALSRARLDAAAREFATLRRPNTKWVQGKERDSATHFVSWRGEPAGWVLERVGQRGETRLGTIAHAADLQAKLPGGAEVRLLLIAPPTDELAAALRLGPESGAAAAVDVVHQPDASADYALEGQLRPDGKLEYAWVLANMANTKGAVSPYPLMTAWAPVGAGSSAVAGEQLAMLAARLGRVHGWLRLQSPPNKLTFPYHLELVEAASGTPAGNRPLVDGEKLKLALAADPEELAAYKRIGAPKAYVYVFLLDSEGKGTLLFPDISEGNSLNKFPILSATDANPDPAPQQILLTRLPADVEISEPFGTDCYFLLATSTPIPDPSILDFQGVGGDRGTSRGGGDPLADMLLGVGSSRSASRGVQTDWLVEWRPYRSVAKK